MKRKPAPAVTLAKSAEHVAAVLQAEIAAAATAYAERIAAANARASATLGKLYAFKA